MADIINIYSDESDHLGLYGPNIVIGALWCTPEAARILSGEVKLAKRRFGVPDAIEVKWTKVSQSQLDYYKALVDLVIDNEDVYFRSVIAPKANLDHKKYNHTPDDFYYILQYYLVRNIAGTQSSTFRIFLDHKDSWSGYRSHKLRDYLQNTALLSSKDFRVQPVRSHEVVGLQLADLLIGAVAFANRPARSGESRAKRELVDYIEQRAGQKLTLQTPPSIQKFNLFFWKPRG